MIYTVLYRSERDGVHPMGLQKGEHGMREYPALDSQDAIRQFTESEIHTSDTVIAVVQGPHYNVSMAEHTL